MKNQHIAQRILLAFTIASFMVGYLVGTSTIFLILKFVLGLVLGLALGLAFIAYLRLNLFPQRDEIGGLGAFLLIGSLPAYAGHALAIGGSISVAPMLALVIATLAVIFLLRKIDAADRLTLKLI